MSGLVIAAAVNIVIGVGLSLISQALAKSTTIEGARIDDLEVTTSTYGKMITITFGTDRVGGNVIWATPGGLKETRVEETEDTGKGFGGGSTTTVSYTYAIDLDLSVGVAGASDVLKMWMDGTLVYDKTGSDDVVAPDDLDFTFYPGGEGQSPDATEESFEGVGFVPAYLHLSRVVYRDLQLADYGNRIPIITVLLSYNTTDTNPSTFMDENGLAISVPSGLDFETLMIIDQDNEVHYATGSNIWRGGISTMTVNQRIDTGINNSVEGTAGRDGFWYGHRSNANNSTPLLKINYTTGADDSSFGITSTLTVDGTNNRRNDGSYHHLQIVGNQGTKNVLLHMMDIDAARASVTDADDMSHLFLLETVGGGGVLTSWKGRAIADHANDRFYTITSVTAGDIEVGRVDFTLGRGQKPAQDEPAPAVVSTVEVTSLRKFTRGSPGDDFENGGNPLGWAFHEDTGNIVIANAGGMILYDPVANSILASVTDSTHVLQSTENFVRGNIFAHLSGGDSNNANIVVRDIRTLEITKTVALSTFGWTGTTGAKQTSSVWDSDTQSIIFSRDSSQTVDERVVKVYVDRKSPTQIPLSDITTALLTSYNGLPLGELESTDFVDTALTPTLVDGYTLSQQGSIADAMEPTRLFGLYDWTEEDWQLKAVLRGGAPVLTIPEDDIGRLRRNDDEITIQETRVQEAEMPMRISVRYSNIDSDYNSDVESSRRVSNPNPTMFTGQDTTLDIPFAMASTKAKRLAQIWLYTIWNERRGLKTEIPWKYLRLTPTDVFNAVLKGETLRLRLGTQDVGVSLATEIEAVTERAEAFTSTLTGGAAIGHHTSVIPGNDPTRVFFLDAPLLLAADLNTGATSVAYFGLAGTGPAWPGGLLYRSPSGTDFSVSGTSNNDVAWATVDTVPSAWAHNRWQEVSDGGTMTIVPMNRSSVWSTTTELAVLNGANAFAVITDAGVEIVQFQTATVNADNTITLDRLLRGRLGTEDKSTNGDMAAGDEIVFLEVSTVTKNNLPLSSLNLSLFWRAVTEGTFLSNAATKTFTYTGRDLSPRSVSHITESFSDLALTSTGLFGEHVFDWERRTRANGEWLDGTGTVPLNEDFERYDFTLRRNSDSVAVINQEVQDATVINVAAATLESVIYPDGNELTNGDAETGDLTGWDALSGAWSSTTLPFGSLTITDPNFPAGASRVFTTTSAPAPDNLFFLRQELDLSTVLGDFVNLERGLVRVRFAASMGQGGASTLSKGAMRPQMTFLDHRRAPILWYPQQLPPDGTWFYPSTNTWIRAHLDTVVPTGTRYIWFLLAGHRGTSGITAVDENGTPAGSFGGTSTNVAFDNAQAFVSDGGSTHTVEVFQKSGTLIEGQLATEPLGT